MASLVTLSQDVLIVVFQLTSIGAPIFHERNFSALPSSLLLQSTISTYYPTANIAYWHT